MRVLHLVASRGAGGAEILVRDVALELRAKGVEVGIAFISRVADLGGAAEFEAPYQQMLDAESIATFDMGHQCRRNPFLGARRLLAIIQQFRPDILHIHLQYGLLFRLLLWPRRIPTVYTHHTDRHRQGRTVFRLLSLTVDHFVAIARQTEHLLRSAVGDRVTRITNAVRFPSTPGTRAKTTAESIQILSVGRLYPPKDYPTLVRTAARLLAARPGLAGRVRFLVAGVGPERESIEAEIAARGLATTVILVGLRTDIPELMTKSDILLMTSAREGLPMTIIEAAHSGLPIVATDVGGVGEVVEHGRNGFLASPGDDFALASYIQQLIDDPHLRSQFSQASLNAAQQFSIGANAEQHLLLYERVLQYGRR